MWTTSGPTHSLECLTWSLHTQHHWLCLLLRSRKCLVVPAEKKAQAPAPWPPFGQYKPRTRLASCWALESLRTHWVPREKKAFNVGGFTLLCFKSPKEKKEHFLPPTPPLNCILPTTSIITTNKYSQRQTQVLLSSFDHQIFQDSKQGIPHVPEPEGEFKSILK